MLQKVCYEMFETKNVSLNIFSIAFAPPEFIVYIMFSVSLLLYSGYK